ncbi:MAG: branched-chain amino acid ABC transporter permease [Nocardioides sp.]|jgi:branched-chain amino acid transport system permease protein
MQVLLTALSQVAVLAPIAMGLVLVYRIGGVINFAAGATCVVSGYVYVALGGGILGAIGTLVIGGLIGVVTFAVSVLPGKVRGTPPVAMTLATLGFALILQMVGDEVFGTSPRSGPTWVSGSVSLAGTNVSVQRLLVIAFSLLSVVIVVALFDRTLFGRGMEASANDEELVRLYGHRTVNFHFVTWFVGGACSALGGVMQASLAAISETAAMPLMITALVGVVFGGIASVRASVLGVTVVCLVGATVERIVEMQIPLTPALVLLLVGLAVRPAGIFASQKTGERV